MFKIFLLTMSVLWNSVGAHSIAQKVESPLINQAVASESTPTLLAQLPTPTPLPAFANNAQPQIQADAWLVRDGATGTVLAEKNGYTKRPPVSTIKIMTALLVLEKLDPSTSVTISSTAAARPGSSAGLRVGESLTVDSLLYGLLLNSGNDAAAALSEIPELYGGTDGFVKAMNDRAQKIGLKDTLFTGPDGYDEAGTLSTPHDMAKLLDYVLKKQSKISQYMLASEKEIRSIDGKNPRMESNSSRFVQFSKAGLISLPYSIEGGKTGTGSHRSLGGAGHTMIVSANKDGKRYQVFIGGTYADTPTASYEQAKALLDFTFTHIQN